MVTFRNSSVMVHYAIVYISACLSDLSISFMTTGCIVFITAGSTIQTLLDNLEVSEVITALLDEDDSYWFKFGQKFGIDRVTLDSLRPDPIKSPAKAMINFIVSRDPDLRMRKFMESLNKIEHNKLIEKLKTMLHISWI